MARLPTHMGAPRSPGHPAFDTPPPPDRASAPSPFRVDEGYSEDPRNPADSDTERDADMKDDLDSPTQGHDRVASARQWLLSQPVEIRTALAQDLIHSLPTSVVADLVRDANHRLHFDPIACLPLEIISPIFDYLDPQSLVSAALTSKAWRHRAYDSRVWRRLFAQEGWTCDKDKLEILEAVAKRQKRPASTAMAHGMDDSSSAQALLPKRYRLSRPLEIASKARSQVSDNGSLDLPDMFLDIGLPTAAGASVDQDMLDAPEIGDASAQQRDPAYSIPANTKLLCWDNVFEQPVINWQYIYSQRRRLELNWFAGTFHNFRLPHPEHQEEAHTQCVYTIQFSGCHLVSGSRDKTVRVWDLDTQRLRLPPLEGHTGSVLCLQFDERPDQDIIVSGGSDADVIIWRFSDGAMINRMAKAHTESVLNLRFDERFLVTCSKDKTIRVWNRRHLSPTDPDYPDKSRAQNATYPAHIVDIQEIASGMSSTLPVPLSPYSLLMTFEGHGAAVNALQVHGHEIVSASGDRRVMLWNIKTGVRIREFTGHTKGIACIQYDGHRIVSGSSDNTVRIFDALTSAELATLDGHRNLVRTVQAEFGDLTSSTESLDAEARRNDRQILESRARGAYGTTGPGQAVGDDAMSVSEDDLETDHRSRRFVLGATLPPGGGGTRWSKIVSGSYDETLIIWRRHKLGHWTPAKELRQEDALRNASRPWRGSRHRRLSQDALPTLNPNPLPQGQLSNAAGASAGALSAEQSARAHAWHLQNFLHQQRQARNAAGGTVAAAAAAAATAEQSSTSTGGSSSAPPTSSENQTPGNPSPLGQPPPDDGSAGTGTAGGQVAPANGQPAHHHHIHRPLPPGTNYTAQNTLHRRPHHHHQHHHHHGMAAAAGGAGPSLNNRVFKLQFDARRIVCCSQEPVIVGWDFAAGYQDLIDASWVFGTPG